MRLFTVRASITIGIFLGSAFANVAFAQSALIATGDSYTRRTGLCGGISSWSQCWDAWGLPPGGTVPTILGLAINSVSYTSYINAASLYSVKLNDNSGRAGETCTDYSGFLNPDNATYHNYGALFAFAPKIGLLAQARSRISTRVGDVVSILIGANDINFGYRSGLELQGCIVSLLNLIANDSPATDGIKYSAKKVIVMTYPPIGFDPIAPANNIWQNPIAAQNVEGVINPAIRLAVAIHNQTYPSRQVFLAETSVTWTANDFSTYTVDGAHPNTLGAWKIAREWARQVCNFGFITCVF